MPHLSCNADLSVLSVFISVPLWLGVCFAQPRTAPVPESAAANLPAQPVGANDLVNVSVYDAPELTRTVRIGADGLMRLPMLKRSIKAHGLMPSDLESAIAEALRAEQLIVDPFVTVTVAEYNSRPISVAGAVKQPVTFQAAESVNLLEALTRAGGLSPEAGPEILVTRAALPNSPALRQRIPVKGLIDAADSALNIPLTGGEEVRVPESGRVYVIGNVKKPGAFPIRDGAESSILKMLALAEGLSPFAGSQAYIYRREANGSKEELPILLRQIMARKSPDVPLLADDILYIPDATGRRAALATLEKVVVFGTSLTTAVVYGATVH